MPIQQSLRITAAALCTLAFVANAPAQTIAELNAGNATLPFGTFTLAAGEDGVLGTADDVADPTVDISGGTLAIDTTGATNPDFLGSAFGSIATEFDEIMDFDSSTSSIVVTAQLPQPLNDENGDPVFVNQFEVHLQDADPELGVENGDTFAFRFALEDLPGDGFGAVEEVDGGGPAPQDGSTFTFTVPLVDEETGEGNELFILGLFDDDGDEFAGNGQLDGLSGILVQSLCVSPVLSDTVGANFHAACAVAFSASN